MSQSGDLQTRWKHFVAEVIQAAPELHDTSRSFIRLIYAVSEEEGVLTLTPNNPLMVRVVENFVPIIINPQMPPNIGRGCGGEDTIFLFHNLSIKLIN